MAKSYNPFEGLAREGSLLGANEVGGYILHGANRRLAKSMAYIFEPLRRQTVIFEEDYHKIPRSLHDKSLCLQELGYILLLAGEINEARKSFQLATLWELDRIAQKSLELILENFEKVVQVVRLSKDYFSDLLKNKKHMQPK